jgi:porin
MAGMRAFHAMSRSLLDLAGRKTPGSTNAGAGGSERSPPPARPSATTRSFHRFLSTVALLIGGFIAFASTANGQQTLLESSPPNVNPTKSDQAASDHLFGDWGGFRTWLANKGIVYTLDYTTESVYNVSGGLRNGADSAYQIGLAVDADWQKLAGLQGFSTHLVLINRGGRNASADYVGDTVIQAQEIYGAGFNQIEKLDWFYGEEKLFDDKVNIVFGRLAPGTNYDASPLYCNFMTLTICGHDRALTGEQGFEDWPLSEWGGRVRLQTADTQYYVMVGAFQSQPFPTSAEPYTQGGFSGWDWTLKGTTGVSIPVEVAYQPSIGPDKMPGHYKLGFNWDTSSYPDNYFDVNGMPLALTGLPGRPHDGRGQFWATADQMIVRNGPKDDDGLILLATYVHDESATTLFRDFVWAGVLDRGFWSWRPNDQIGFGATWYDVSKGLTQTEQLQASLGMPLAGGALGAQTHGEILELNYAIQVSPAVLIQPELEYFIRPGATGAVPNSFLVGLKTHLDF